MTTLQSVVSDNIRATTARRRGSQQALAAAIGVTQQSMSLKLSGRRPLTVDELEIIARELEVQPATLLDRGDS
jgi:transcriptional regulator with XRE-family HTH domain